MATMLFAVIICVSVIAFVLICLFHFSSYGTTKQAVRFGYFKYSLSELHEYRFQVTVQRKGYRAWHKIVRVQSYKNGALYRDHWIDNWTTRGAYRLSARIRDDLQGYLVEE